MVHKERRKLVWLRHSIKKVNHNISFEPINSCPTQQALLSQNLQIWTFFFFLGSCSTLSSLPPLSLSLTHSLSLFLPFTSSSGFYFILFFLKIVHFFFFFLFFLPLSPFSFSLYNRLKQPQSFFGKESDFNDL